MFSGLGKFYISLLFACFVTVFMVADLSAQEAPRVYEKLDVKLRQLQVNVVTKKGAPITGLSNSDFQVIVGGKKQTIVDVTEITLDDLGNSKNSEEISELGRRLFVFFFDLRYTTKLGLLNARKSAADFVANQLSAKDIASVVSYHPDKGIALLCPFTNDRQLLHQAVNTLGLVTTTQRGRAGYYSSNAFQRNYVNVENTNIGIDALVAEGQEANDGPNASPEMVALINEQRILQRLADVFTRSKNVEEDVYRNDVNKYLFQFQGFGKALNQIRGRKNLIWFSSGFDEKVLTGNSDTQIKDDSEAISHGEIWNVSSDSTGNVGVQSNLGDAVSNLQNSNTIIFAIDTSLNENPTGGQSGLQSLNAFSKDTGGRMFRNSNDLAGPLRQIRDITNHYYLLTFQPSATLKKGTPLKMRIKAAAKGAQVYANRSITIDEDFSKLSQLGKTFQISDYLARDVVSDAVNFSSQHFVIPSEQDFSKVMVITDIERTYLEKTGLKGPVQFEVFIQATRQIDQVVFDSFYFRFGVEGKKIKNNKTTKGLRYFSDLFLKPGEYALKTVVRDLKSGEIGSQIQSLTIANSGDALQGPFVIAEEPWVFIRPDQKTQKDQRGLELDYSYPFQIQGKMQVPTSVANFAADGNYGFYFFLDNNNTEPSSERPKMNAVFMDDQQKMISIPGEAIAAGANFGKSAPYLTGVMFKIDFAKVGLQPGKAYQLLAQFIFEGKDPYRSMHPIQIAP